MSAVVDGERDGKAAPPRLTRACLTVLQLLHERGRGTASPFYPYLSVLPYDHRLPMEWNETELQLLQACKRPFPWGVFQSLDVVCSSANWWIRSLVKNAQ